MARIPDSLGAAPTPSAPVNIARPQVMSDGMDRLGSALANAGNEIGAAMKQEQKRINSAKVEDAFNQLRNAQLDLTNGEQNGFMNMRGGDAVKKPLLKDYSGMFTASAGQLAAGLDNDEQRQAFGQRANVAQSQFTQDILQHLYRENNVYQGQVVNATLDIERRTAAAKWDKPLEVESSLARIGAAVGAESKRLGLPEEAAQDMLLQEQGKVHDGVIKQALASKQYDYAKQWFTQYRDQIDAPTAKLLEHEVGQAAQKQLYNDYQSAFLSSADSQKGLSQLYKQISTDKTLDDDRKNILIGRIQNRADMLENRAARDQDRRERGIERQISAVNALTMQGYSPTAEQMAPLVAAARGTSLQPMVTQMIQTANVTSQFRNMDFRQQETALTEMQAAARKDPTKFDVSMIGKMQTIHDNQKREVQADPTSFAIRQGFIDPRDPAAQPLDFSKPDVLGQQLGARFGLARTVASKYQTAVKPLTSEEEDTLKNALTKAGPQQKREIFATLSKASGQDFDGYKGIMAQLSPDDPVTAIAGTFAGRGYVDPGAKAQSNVADMMLRGQAIMNPKGKDDGTPEKGKLWPLPQGKDLASMRTMFVNQVGDAYAGMPKAQSDLMQAAHAIYAAKVSDKGDATGILDSDAWKSSITLATGGVDKYNGKSTVLPWGMPYKDFKNQVGQRIDGIVATGNLADGVTASRLGDMPLQAVADGKYVLRAGDGVLVDKKNRPVVIDFNTAAPVQVAKPPANFNALINMRAGRE